MSYDTVTTATCKTLQSLGMSPRKEHQIENALRSQIESSGPEFVLSRLSSLSDWRKMHMKGDTSYHPLWWSYKRDHDGACIPTDRVGSQIWGMKDKTFFTVVGALRKAVTLSIPSEKQLVKWIDAVRCENNSNSAIHTSRYGEHTLDYLEGRLRRSWESRPWFNVSDITGTNIPGSGKCMKLHRQKVNGRMTNAIDPHSLISAYEFSVSTAPLFIWKFLDDISAPSLMGVGVEAESEGYIGSLQSLINAKLADGDLQDEAVMGNFLFSEEDRLADANRYVTRWFGFAHCVGNIGFLEQEGGKLRTVANPNRFVQWANFPLGAAFSDLQRRNSDCYVYNQEEGMLWAQSKLRGNIPLSSFDMSSATDRLDYQKWLSDKFQLLEQDEERWSLLSRSLDLFRDTSEAPWSVPGHVADLIGAKTNEVSWTVGQPLGLRPSFPILTLMNADFARNAIIDVDGSPSRGHFACVGDDLIIETKYAEAYMRNVESFNGKINNEKTMESSRYAEFCSHMITKSSIYPLKPRWILDVEGSTQNVDKFTTRGLHPRVPRWAQDIHDKIARFHLNGCEAIPYSVSDSPRDLLTRVGVNALIAACHPGPRDTEKVSLQTLYEGYYATEQVRSAPVYELSTSWADDAYPAFGGSHSAPRVSVSLSETHQRTDQILGTISTDSSTSVEVPVIKDWDYRKGSYVQPTSKLAADKRLVRDLDRIAVSESDGLITATSVDHGIETSVVIDTDPANPHALLVHQKKDEQDSSFTRVQSIQDLILEMSLRDPLTKRGNKESKDLDDELEL